MNPPSCQLSAVSFQPQRLMQMAKAADDWPLIAES
jgi:hypothetical protein